MGKGRPSWSARDPAGRADQAAVDLLAVIREGHEMIQGARDAVAGLRTACTEAARIVTDLAPGTVARQVDERLRPIVDEAVTAAVNKAIERVTAAFEECVVDVAAAYSGAVHDAVGIKDVLGPDVGDQCPFCGACGAETRLKGGSVYEAVDGSAGKPKRGNVGICAQCGEVSTYDLDVAGTLISRKPTQPEIKAATRSREVRRALRSVAAAPQNHLTETGED